MSSAANGGRIPRRAPTERTPAVLGNLGGLVLTMGNVVTTRHLLAVTSDAFVRSRDDEEESPVGERPTTDAIGV